MTLELLKEFGHKHGILTTGYADSNLIAFFHKLVITDGLYEHAVNISLEFLSQGLFDIFPSLFRIQILLNLSKHPFSVAALKAVCFISLFIKLFSGQKRKLTVLTVKHQLLVLWEAVILIGNVRKLNSHGIRHLSGKEILLFPEIYEMIIFSL